MGGGKGSRVEYVERPQAMRAPEQSQEERDYLTQQKQQMAEMQSAYRTNLDALNSQYANSQQQSASVLQQLKMSADSQRQTADANRADLAAAQAASGKQLELLAASRDQATGQLAQSRTEQVNQTTGMMDRLSRRRAARKIRY